MSFKNYWLCWQLLNGLDQLDWPNSVKELQRNWIGKSEGCEINFKANDINIPVFTTRADTIFGATYIVLAPENELVLKLTAPEKLEEVKKYIDLTANKSEIERKDESRTKTGVFFRNLCN